MSQGGQKRPSVLPSGGVEKSSNVFFTGVDGKEKKIYRVFAPYFSRVTGRGVPIYRLRHENCGTMDAQPNDFPFSKQPFSE